ncbi:HAUS augmin-like complex subunit 6 [Bombina bombina]|uniref:HAUS augmin-like complex subunit 6 n=1 Tax=Bombina bombina TaxID=8345 RepID=UPI00235B0CF8|nr:HAUS augmin-like complex subunit 6 [Bombina bombina]
MQSGPRPQPTWQKEHLWMALQGLGFDPGSEAAATGKALTHVTTGVNMFDKPNKDAFYMVFHFLFAELDSARCKEVFRFCWPPYNKKQDAEFRKACCDWLRKISDEVGNGFPQVVASIFLSPGGPKFVQLLYHFTKYVLLHHIKRDVDGANAFIPDALQIKHKDPQKALARNNVARQRYLQVLQRENLVISKYQEKAQLLTKQIRDLRSEYIMLQNQLKAMKTVDINHSKTNETVKEIRRMWNIIMQTLKMIEKEIDVVESVVKGNVDQYCIDGTNVTLNIPGLLVSKIESEMHRLQMENVYEAGKINLVTVVQLLNEALKMVRQERCESDSKELKLDFSYLNGKTKYETELLTRLRLMRHKIRREDLVSINKSIADKQTEWEKKWEIHLGKPPFCLFQGLNQALELNTLEATSSFDPASQEILSRNMFSQYPPSLPALATTKEIHSKDLDLDYSGSLLRSLMDSSVLSSSLRNSSNAASKTPLKRRMSLNEKELRTPIQYIRDRNVLQRTLSPTSVQKRRSAEIWKTESKVLPHTPTPRKQDDPVSMARQQLVQQVADYIDCGTPRSNGGRGMELDDLIGMLSSDPFLSRKEIPRTPENLISDIRTSWRKAIQTDETPHTSIPLETPRLESPVELEPAYCSQIDMSMACFMSTSCISDANDSLEMRRSSTGRQIFGQPLTLRQSANDAPSENLLGQGDTFVMEEEREMCKLVPSLIDTNRTFALDKQSECSLLDSTSLSAQKQENPSAHTTLSWDSSNMFEHNHSYDSHDVIQFGILHETLPEGAGNLSLNSTKSIDADESMENVIVDSGHLLKKTECGLETIERKIDLETIRSRYEALKKHLTFCENDSLHSRKRFSKPKSESSLPHEVCNMFSPLEKGLALDLDNVKTTSAKERKLSLPQLIVFSPSEDLPEKQANITDAYEFQGSGKLNKTFDFKREASEPPKNTDEVLGQIIKF